MVAVSLTYLGGLELAICQQPIVLRDLSVIRGESVTGIDEHYVQLSGGRKLGWEEILKASVKPELQLDFDEKIVSLGLPLFRIKHRLSIGDWAGLGDLAKRQYQNLQFDGLESEQDSPRTYLVCVATMKGRLYRGDRAGAILPFLQAAKIQNRWQSSRDAVGTFLPDEDARQLLSSEILPIWFDHEQVEAAFSVFANAFVPTSATEDSGPVVYLASMAIEMKRLQLARQLVDLLAGGDREAKSWRLILLAQIQIAEGNAVAATEFLKQHQSNLVGATVPMASYLKAASFYEPGSPSVDLAHPLNTMQRQVSDEKADAMLQLLEIPAEFGERYPVLASAALYQSSQIAKSLAWKHEEQILKQELLARYPRSYHGKLVENSQVRREK